MIAQAVAFVVGAILDLVILAALVRFWMQALRAPSRNPLCSHSRTLSRWVASTIAPMSVSGSSASPTTSRSVAAAKRSRNASWIDSCTRILAVEVHASPWL